MPTVTIRETYDLSTKSGKMTLIGIHTPTKNIIQRLYPGFCEQYKFVKILHQNVRVASASRLPLDPAGVGANSEGLVSPEDVFNPIMYKACSNQSLSNLEYRIRGLSGTTYGESVKQSNNDVTEFSDEFNVYYSLLSNTRGWKIAHPQAGFSMRKLRPLVYEKWYNEGVNRQNSNTAQTVLTSDTALPSDIIPIDSSDADANVIGSQVVQSMRGRPHRMPAFNTKYLTAVADGGSSVVAGTTVRNGMADGFPSSAQQYMPDIPVIYTGIVLVPPSKTTVLYYRMVVETVVSFFGIQSMDEIVTMSALNNRSEFPVYWNDYRSVSKEHLMTVEENTVSTSEGASLTKIMEA